MTATSPPRLVGLALKALAALSLAAPAPMVASAEPSAFDFSGFATLGAVKTDRKDVWFTRYGVNFPGKSDPDLTPDSVLGLQGSLRLPWQNDLTVQVLTREDGSDRIQPRVTLAFLRQTLAPGLSLRAGRLRAPFFMLSESLHVNYAHPWVRPPVEVYSLNPFNDLDGVDLIYHRRVGELDVEIHPYFGRSRIPFPEGRARLNRTWGLNLVFAHGDWSLHLGHGDGRFSLIRGDAQTQALIGGLAGTPFNAALADISGTEGKTRFDSIGLQWDDGRWQVIGEYARRTTNRYVTSSEGWYLSLGRRFGAVTPYAVLARQRLDQHLSTVPVPGEFWQLFLRSRNNAQRSATIGLRWDLARNAALKTELTRARPDHDSWGSYFPRSDPRVQIGGRAIHTWSVSVDVTF